MLLLPAHAQQTVYDLPADPAVLLTCGYLTITQDTEYGELATLGGSDRLLAELLIPVYSNIARSASVTASLYARSSTGTPETLLWTDTLSLAFHDNLTNAGINQILFDGIDVVAPDDLIWTVSFAAITPYDPATPGQREFGPILNEAARLGPAGAATDPAMFWQRAVGSPLWLQSSLASGHDSTLSALLSANPVPEPVSSMLAGMVALGWAVHRKRRSLAPAPPTPPAAAGDW
jgi:hypothetical protein